MKVTSRHKKGYHKLDEIGFVGSQKSMSSKEVKLEVVKTTRAIRTLKASGKSTHPSGTNSHSKKARNVTNA